MTLNDLLRTPNPQLEAALLRSELKRNWGISGSLRELGSTQDLNFLVVGEGGEEYLLRIANRSWDRGVIELQNAAMRHMAGAELGVAIPVPVLTLAGEEIIEVDQHLVRLLTWVTGTPLSARDYLSRSTMRDLGRLAARSQAAMAGFTHPHLDRRLQWDPRQAATLVEELGPRVDDQERLAAIEAAMAPFAAMVDQRVDRLPVQAIHCDVTDYNVIGVPGPAGEVNVVGLIDFGDVTQSWRVAEVVNAAAAAVVHDLYDALGAALAVLDGFLEVATLEEDEAEAFWPLVLARCAALSLSSAHQLDLVGATPHLAQMVAEDRAVLAAVLDVPPPLATAAVRHVCGFLPSPKGARLAASITGVTAAPIVLDTGPLVAIDLSMESDRLRYGAGKRDDTFRDAVSTPAGCTPVGRWGEVRLAAAGDPAGHPPDALHLGVDVFVAPGTLVHAPLPGTVEDVAADEMLLAVDLGDEPVLLRLAGIVPNVERGTQVAMGEPVAEVRAPATGPPHAHVQLMADGPVPGLTRARDRVAALALCPDPSPLLGISAAAVPREPSSAQVARRAATMASVQKLYFTDPPEIVRGWREWLYDADGRPYIDGINNVTILGHSRRELAEAAARQLGLLNTNARFLYRQQAEFAERLTSLFPDELDTVFLVNSGSEAADLALQIANAFTGRRDVVSLEGCYHGWTTGPAELCTFPGDRPVWREAIAAHVHVAAQPDPYRGVFGATAEPYVESVRNAIARAGGPVAFICEPLLGNQGGIVLPHGYLKSAYAAVRAAGGVCIADEVQVGYGRTGSHLWAFQGEEVVPDIVCVAKAAGNGFPLGAVICRGELADAFGSSGTFFSSAGGSPVSCAVGMAVIDVLFRDELQANAAYIGSVLRAGIEQIADNHEQVGGVLGRGLYLGVDLVQGRLSKAPAPVEAVAVCERMRELGVIVQPTGDRGNVLKLKPPLCISEQSARTILDALDRTLTDICGTR
jgi:4-aminobutyrate aminotransferase-like enzyme/Ser/Thr protein kinase RdoA (MazF antagonist)